MARLCRLLMCMHVSIHISPSVFPRRGNCKKASLGLVCEIGLRCRTYYVLCGSVLSVWTKVEGVLASVSGTNVKMQIVRLRTEDGQRIVGKRFCFGCRGQIRSTNTLLA